MFMSRRVNHELSKLEQAQRSGQPEAIQKAYEDFFLLCRANQLDLPNLLRKAESRRHSKVA